MAKLLGLKGSNHICSKAHSKVLNALNKYCSKAVRTMGKKAGLVLLDLGPETRRHDY